MRLSEISLDPRNLELALERAHQSGYQAYMRELRRQIEVCEPSVAQSHKMILRYLIDMQFDEDGGLLVYRAFSFANSGDRGLFMNGICRGSYGPGSIGVGECWAYTKKGAYPYQGPVQDNLPTALLRLDGILNIDGQATSDFLNHTHNFEDEVRLSPGTPIRLTGMFYSGNKPYKLFKPGTIVVA